MTDEQKVKAISEAYDLADKTAKASVAPGYTLDSWMKKAEEAEKKYRIPRETYVSLYSRTSGIESLRYKDKDEDKNGTPGRHTQQQEPARHDGGLQDPGAERQAAPGNV